MFELWDCSATSRAQHSKTGQGLGRRSVWAPRDLNIPEITSQLLWDFRAVLETPPGHQGDVFHPSVLNHRDAAFTKKIKLKN